MVIVSFLSKILGRNQDFPKGSVWGEVTFQSAWREVLVRDLNFQISAWEELWLLTIYNVCRHFRHKKYCSNSNLPMLWHHSFMFANLNKDPWKSGLCERSNFWKCLGRNRFREELKILDFAWGNLPLDDALLSKPLNVLLDIADLNWCNHVDINRALCNWFISLVS